MKETENKLQGLRQGDSFDSLSRLVISSFVALKFRNCHQFVTYGGQLCP
jgi:hypothetical protein